MKTKNQKRGRTFMKHFEETEKKKKSIYHIDNDLDNVSPCRNVLLMLLKKADI